MNTSQSITVAAIQMPCVGEVDANVSATLEAVREAAGQGARLICLQELFSSIYFCQSEDHDQFELAESIPGPRSIVWRR